MKFKMKRWQKIGLILAVSFCALAILVAEIMMTLKLRGMYINFNDKICITTPPYSEITIKKGSITFKYKQGVSKLMVTNDSFEPSGAKFKDSNESIKVSQYFIGQDTVTEVFHVVNGQNYKSFGIEGDFRWPTFIPCANVYYDHFLKKWEN